MAEYIEREAAIHAVVERFWSKQYVSDVELANAIESVSAADVVEVVRCKDCKHCLPVSMHCIRTTAANKYPKMKADDFCSYGERRADNG